MSKEFTRGLFFTQNMFPVCTPRKHLSTSTFHGIFTWNKHFITVHTEGRRNVAGFVCMQGNLLLIISSTTRFLIFIFLFRLNIPTWVRWASRCSSFLIPGWCSGYWVTCFVFSFKKSFLYSQNDACIHASMLADIHINKKIMLGVLCAGSLVSHFLFGSTLEYISFPAVLALSLLD